MLYLDIYGYIAEYRQTRLPYRQGVSFEDRVPSLSNGNEMSPSLQERRPFMHSGDSYTFLMYRVLIYSGISWNIGVFMGI